MEIDISKMSLSELKETCQNIINKERAKDANTSTEAKRVEEEEQRAL